MHLPLFIAGRYLFAKKSHNVINIISAISAAGMAVGTAALVIILSVYNGFDDLVSRSLNEMDPDYLVVPAAGKVFEPQGAVFDWLAQHPDVAATAPVLQENVFVSYEGNQGMALAKGIEDDSLVFGDLPRCAVGTGLAYRLGINPGFVANLEIYYPDRTASINMANPMASVESIKAHPERLLSVNAEVDNTLVQLPLAAMRELTGYATEVSGIEVRLREGLSARAVRRFGRDLAARLGDGLAAKDRYRQNEALFKMMKYEKAAVFLILLFVVIIIAFNIFGSLTMLLIDKRGDIETLRSLGATPQLVRRIFVLEGWLISLLGLSAGLVAGLALALLQQRYGLIPLPGNYLVSSYPVIIQPLDILLVAVSTALVGYLIARFAVSRSKVS
ncbi:MAG: FtsX-like permease family protein [Bacteroidales bacterium]|nr:FtsX-like permease family protein [Bacteroidales bacterium]